MPKPKNPSRDDLISEFETMLFLAIVAMVKLEVENGHPSGTMICPRCRSHQLRWSTASNGHSSAACQRQYEDPEDESLRRCFSFIE